jgi:cysteine sulfinate desulfinase/cysteine desulfurase-like protein
VSHPGLADGPIFLDYNATTPTDPRVVEAALRVDVLVGFGRSAGIVVHAASFPRLARDASSGLSAKAAPMTKIAVAR